MKNKKIKLTYDGKDYTLEYTRQTISQLENRGFIAADFAEKPATMLPLAFKGAFLKNHKFVKDETIEEIFNHIKDKQGLIAQLSTMLVECYETLMNDTEVEDDKGNAVWEMTE